MEPDRGSNRRWEKKKNCTDTDNKMANCRKQELLASPAVKCTDIEHADYAGEVSDQYPDKRPELPEKRKLFIGHGVQQGQQRNVEQGQSYFVLRIFNGNSYD